MSAPIISVRWTHPERDRDSRIEVIRRAWQGAYRHIFSPAEIDGVFDGEITMTGDWTDRRTAPVGTLVAEAAAPPSARTDSAESEVVGLISLGLMEPGVGEVAALYVAPPWQGRGAGQQLWDAGVVVLEHRGVERLEVWALADAAARGFYERNGCRLVGDGEFALGDHTVRAIQYARSMR